LKVTKEKEENRQAFITVEMEPAEMETAMQDAYLRLAPKANIPGFRKGKAPRAIVERHLGKSRLLEEALDRLLPQAYEQALKEQEIDPFAQPDVEITQTDPLIFKAVVPLTPEVELGDYQGIRITPDPVDITDENVNAVIEELRHQHATWEPVDRPLDYDDLAIIDINGTVEDSPYVQKVGAQIQVFKDLMSPAPGFSDQIVGMNKEEEKEFNLSFPEDYPNDKVAGKEGHFKVKLTEIKKEKLPEVNDEFAGQVSPDFTVDALRQEVVNSLKARAEERARMDFEEKVIDSAIEKAKVEYPPVLIELEINRILNEQVRQLQASGRNMDDYLQSINKTMEQLREELRPVATRNVTASLVMSKVAEAEKIEVTEEDIENGIANMTRGAGNDKIDELRRLLNTGQTRESLKQSLKTRKTIERLSEIAKKTEEVKKETKPKKKKTKKEEEK
jgi:trigger factor